MTSRRSRRTGGSPTLCAKRPSGRRTRMSRYSANGILSNRKKIDRAHSGPRTTMAGGRGIAQGQLLDEESLGIAVEARPEVLAICRSHLRHHLAARAAAAEVEMRLRAALPRCKFDSAQYVIRWLAATARRVCLEYRRDHLQPSRRETLFDDLRSSSCEQGGLFEPHRGAGARIGACYPSQKSAPPTKDESYAG